MNVATGNAGTSELSSRMSALSRSGNHHWLHHRHVTMLVSKHQQKKWFWQLHAHTDLRWSRDAGENPLDILRGHVDIVYSYEHIAWAKHAENMYLSSKLAQSGQKQQVLTNTLSSYRKIDMPCILGLRHTVRVRKHLVDIQNRFL